MIKKIQTPRYTFHLLSTPQHFLDAISESKYILEIVNTFTDPTLYFYQNENHEEGPIQIPLFIPNISLREIKSKFKLTEEQFLNFQKYYKSTSDGIISDGIKETKETKEWWEDGYSQIERNMLNIFQYFYSLHVQRNLDWSTSACCLNLIKCMNLEIITNIKLIVYAVHHFNKIWPEKDAYHINWNLVQKSWEYIFFHKKLNKGINHNWSQDHIANEYRKLQVSFMYSEYDAMFQIFKHLSSLSNYTKKY